MNPESLPDFDDLRKAQDRLRNRALVTPVLRNVSLDTMLGCTLFLKCDHLQPMGAFKLRGASNAVTCLEEKNIQGDVATHSSGNHGAALALAARLAGRKAHVVMPRNAIPRKIEAVRHHGGEVILCESTQAAREAGLAALVAEGLIPIPPYDHPDIIAGQGTAALELFDQAGESLDYLVAPIGGGGLLAGCALAARTRSPDTLVVGAEPAGASDTAASLARGARVEQWSPDTIADGLRALVGIRNFALIQDLVSEVLLADDDEIVAAMRLAYEQAELCIEPSAAVALAVIAAHARRFAGRRVGVIITGGNVDTEQFPWLVDGAGS